MLKLSVKGSQDGGWALTQSYLSKEIRADYHGAADRWLARDTFQTAICLVQFADVPDDELPRMYLAWPAEVAAQLRNASRGEAIRSCGKIICTDLALSPPERGTDYRMIGG